MKKDKYIKLHDAGVFQYGSAELLLFEKRLTQYFSREYKLHKKTEPQKIPLNTGPIALSADDLAEHHYDEGLDFFKNFLDATTMSYTMAYYNDDPDKIIDTGLSLDEAQLAKFELITQRMKLQGDEKLLNFGCGFGYFESFLLDKFPSIEIASLTHSKDQYGFIVERMKDEHDALSSSRFKIFFGEIDQQTCKLVGQEKYDIACSVGLMEQINNIESFYNIIARTLVADGRMFHHLIVSRDLIPQLMDPDKTLIGKYFPGGKVLPYYALKNDFAPFHFSESWFVNGINYWQTLDEWHKKFWDNIGNIYPETMDAERVKYWNNYFVLCKAMFFPENGAAYGNGQYLYYKTQETAD